MTHIDEQVEKEKKRERERRERVRASNIQDVLQTIARSYKTKGQRLDLTAKGKGIV